MMYKFKNILLCLFLCAFIFNSYGQQVFESGIIYGGVTGGGFSTNTGSGTVTTNVAIPPNSTIKKAYLIATRDGVAPDINVILNGISYTFSDFTTVTDTFVSTINTWIWSKSTIHAIDITNDIDSSVTIYNLTIPLQFNITVNGFYSSFYLYIVYENLTLPKLAYYLMFNQQDVSINETYNITNLNPIYNLNPVGLGLFGVFFCDTIQDGSYITVNNDTIGLVGGQESNTLYSCTGVYANFAYYNNTLFGLEDDTPDSLMAATDVLADIKSNLNNLDTFVKIASILQTPGINGGQLTNPIAALILSYSTPCDTFSTSITPGDTICFGDSMQLQATGGVQYSWFGAFGGLSDTTIANPVASPPQTTTYICTIKNDSGCVKTEHVKVWVIQPPNSFTVKNSICGDSTGSITVNNMPSGYTYALYNNALLVDSNVSGVFNNLPGGVYLLKSYFPSKGCVFYDTLSIQDSNIVQASFWRNPTTGKAPLTVQFGNQSQNATNYLWYFPTDTLTTVSPTYTFEQGGTYTVYLIAYNNLLHCADTASYTFYIEGDISISIPNVFTPNGDGINDAFALAITGANEIEQLSVSIFNRWGQQLAQRTFGAEVFTSSQVITDLTIWDGHTNAGDKAPEGTYFYTIKYKDINGAEQLLKGSFSLLR